MTTIDFLRIRQTSGFEKKGMKEYGKLQDSEHFIFHGTGSCNCPVSVSFKTILLPRFLGGCHCGHFQAYVPAAE